MNHKIALIAPFLTHYRREFYRKLDKANDFNTVFFFQNKKADDGRPGVDFEQAENIQSYTSFVVSVGAIKLVFSFDLIRKINKQKPGIILLEGASSNLTSWYFILFRKHYGMKVISWACGWQPEIHHTLVRKFKCIIERSFFNNVDWIISYSSTALRYFRGIGVKTPVTIAYNGIDTEIFYQMKDKVYELAEGIRSEYNKKIFLYVGGLFKEKKVDFLIESFLEFQTEMPETCLWIIGDGPLRRELEAKAGNRNIKFFGRIEEGVDSFFAAADFFILPGVGGLALNQAMLWGTPCIVSEADGTENDLVIDNSTGFRFLKDNKESLKMAMKKALSLKKEEKIEMSKRAQKLVLERSNTDEMVNTFSRVLEKFH